MPAVKLSDLPGCNPRSGTIGYRPFANMSKKEKTHFVKVMNERPKR